MKTFLAVILLAVMVIAASAQSLNTIVVGNSSMTNSLIVSGKSCKLYAVTGQNLSGSTFYLQVYQSITNPIAGSVPTFSVPVLATPQFYSIDFSYYGADLSPGCRVFISSSSTNYAALGNVATIQAISKSN